MPSPETVPKKMSGSPSLTIEAYSTSVGGGYVVSGFRNPSSALVGSNENTAALVWLMPITTHRGVSMQIVASGAPWFGVSTIISFDTLSAYGYVVPKSRSARPCK